MTSNDKTAILLHIHALREYDILKKLTKKLTSKLRIHR
nr:MAG TPA: hypothetical protein [Caudoviricetes sp.]